MKPQTRHWVARAAAAARQGSGWRQAGAELLQHWRERVDAARYCRHLCALYLLTRATEPALRGEALYAAVVQRERGIPADEAAAIVEAAADSYAAWPTPRALRFRDVVHYLVVTHVAEQYGWVGDAPLQAVRAGVPSDW